MGLGQAPDLGKVLLAWGGYANLPNYGCTSMHRKGENLLAEPRSGQPKGDGRDHRIARPGSVIHLYLGRGHEKALRTGDRDPVLAQGYDERLGA